MPDDKWEQYATNAATADKWDKYATAAPSTSVPGAPNGLPPYPDVKGSVQPSNLGTIATGPPLMSMQPGLPSPAQVPENATRMQQGAAIGSPVGGLISGGAAAAPAIARSMLGASVVGGAGDYYATKLIGPTAGKVAGVLGGLVGGVAGAKGTKFTGGKLGFLEKIFADTEDAPLAKKTADITDPSIESQDLINRMKKLVVPGQQPTAADLKRAGDLTQAPMELLKSLDKFGDKLATNEINRRLLMGKIPGLR